MAKKKKPKQTNKKIGRMNDGVEASGFGGLGGRVPKGMLKAGTDHCSDLGVERAVGATAGLWNT